MYIYEYNTGTATAVSIAVRMYAVSPVPGTSTYNGTFHTFHAYIPVFVSWFIFKFAILP